MPTNSKFYLIDGAPTQKNQARKRDSLGIDELTLNLIPSLSRRRLFDNTLSIQVPTKESQPTINQKPSKPKIYDMDPK
jgi:hypothetical protein